MIVAMPWDNYKLEMKCRYHVLLFTSAATVSCLKLVPLTLDCFIRVFQFSFYSQFHANSIYNHLLTLVIVGQVAPFLSYEANLMYPASEQNPNKCDINEDSTGYELYLVSIIVYLSAFIFVGYTMFYVAGNYKNAQNSEVKLMNNISIGLSVVTLFSILELNPCYDVTANLDLSKDDETTNHITWDHLEHAFGVGIAAKNITESVMCMILTSTKASRVTRKVLTFLCCPCSFRRKQNKSLETRNSNLA